MSELSISKRGVEVITSASDLNIDNLSLDIALPAPIKTGSSRLAQAIREVRKRVKVQRVAFAITDVSVSPLTASIDAVDMEAAEVFHSISENRTGTKHGATVRLTDVDEVTCQFAVAAGDTVDVEVQVKETLKELGATARILDESTIRVEWDRELETGEKIVLAWELVDLDEVADMLLEVQFRLQRVLGELGVNQIQDGIVRDDVGNIVEYRSRTFTTKELAVSATEDIEDGEDLEEGEMSRRKVTIDIDIRKNDRKLLISTLDGLMDTPGLTINEEV